MKLPRCPRCDGKLLATYAERVDAVERRELVDVACLSCGRLWGTFRKVVTITWELVSDERKGAA